MAFKLRVFNAQAKFPNEVNIQAINKVVSQADIENILEKTGKRELRLRKLSVPPCGIIWFCIALNLYTTEGYKDVLSKLVKGLRYIWPNPNLQFPVKSALSQVRYRLGVAPMVELFRQTSKPIADLSVPGAYLFGLRLMAIDGTTEDVADSSENAAYFGRHTGSRGDSAFPQAQIVYERGAHLLARVGAHWKLKPVQLLEDGSDFAYIYPSDYRRKKPASACWCASSSIP